MAGGRLYKVAKRAKGWKKKRRRKRKSYLPRIKLLLGNSHTCRLRYTEAQSINPGAGGICGVNVYRANGMYDVDITGVGHQPRGFDQFMNMFDHFTVTSAVITATFLSTDGTYNTTVGVALRDKNDVELAPSDYTEHQNVKWKLMSTNDDSKVIKMGFNAKSFFNISNPLNEKDLAGTAAANPTEGALFHVFVAPLQAVDAGAVDVYIQIDYCATFTEPTELQAS